MGGRTQETPGRVGREKRTGAASGSINVCKRPQSRFRICPRKEIEFSNRSGFGNPERQRKTNFAAVRLLRNRWSGLRIKPTRFQPAPMGSKISVPFLGGGAKSAPQCSHFSRSTSRRFLHLGQDSRVGHSCAQRNPNRPGRPKSK